MSTHGIKFEKEFTIELTESDKRKSLNNIIKKYYKIEKGYEVFIIDNENYISFLEFYYNNDGIIEYYKKVTEIPIYELEEYGICIGKEIKIGIVYGIGGLGSLSDILQIYEAIEKFCSDHPMLIGMLAHTVQKVILPIIKQKLQKIGERCSIRLFKKSLYHKKEITVEEFNKAYGVKTNDKNDGAAVEIILEYMGYEYDKQKCKWILKNKRK